MGRGDVICLQQGERGCYTASHWWNLHAAYREVVEHNDDGEYDASTLFYGWSSNTSTPSTSSSLQPRTVCVDAKGSVRRELRPSDTAEGPTSPSNVDPARVELWDGAVNDVTGSGPVRGVGTGVGVRGRNVRKDYFGDFMGVFSDLTKMHVLSTIQRWGPEERAWSVHGERCPVHRDELESIEDSIRILAEKSDSLAGFVVMADDRGVWGNVASSVLEEMRDDYKGKATFLFATRRDEGVGDSADAGDARGKSRFMEGLAVSSLAPLVDLYVPVHGRGETVDGLFCSSLVGAVGIFGATLPLMSQEGMSSMDMASMATSLGSWHHRCPLTTLDVYSPVFASPVALSGHAREGDVGRITECVSMLGTGKAARDAIGDEARMPWFDVDDVTLSRPSTRAAFRAGAGVPVVRGMDEAPDFFLPAGSRSIACAAVLGSTTAFAPRLSSLAGWFDPRHVREQAALLDSWGVRDRCDEIREELLSMAECFDLNHG